MKTDLNDQSHRDAAVSDLDRNMVVLAGAGTGKTTILIDRLSRLILEKDIPVERIVALTFTKKAAEEMRVRLETKLREAGTDAAEKALHGIPKSQIGTIHSFAGYLLRLYPLQAGVDPHFREDDGTEADLVFEKEWESWCREEFSGAGDHSNSWSELLQKVAFADIKETALAMSSPFIDSDQLKPGYSIKKWAAHTSRELKKLAESVGPPVKPAAIDRILGDMTRGLDQTAKTGRLPDGLREAFVEMSKPGETKSWKAHPTAYERFLEVFNEFKLLCRVDDETVSRLIQRLHPFVVRFGQEKRRLGIVSFDELLVKARNLLRDHPAVRRALKSQFHTFLIDEFQDTDPLQGEILFYLAERVGEEKKDWRSIRLEPGRLFVVGDPQQSIYKFRGADIAAFTEFRDAMVEQGAREAVLSANFRSRPGILESVNSIFPSLLVEEANVQPPFVPLQSVREEKNPSVDFFETAPPEGGAAPTADSVRDFEADWMADWIIDQVETKGSYHYRDIAVLLRSTAPFTHYLEALRRRGVPYVAEGEKYFYRTPEVVDFVNLASAVANSDDKLALVGVLRSPVGGLTDREIFDLKRADGLDYRNPPPLHRDKINWLYDALRALSSRAHQRPVGRLIQEMMERTWILELTSTGSNGDQAVSNLLKIRRLADAWSETEPLDLPSFVRRFKKYREDEKEEGENPLSDIQYDAVRVLTIHKAKGLEFPVVVMPNLFAERPKGPARSPVLIRDWSSGLAGLRLNGSKLINSNRLFLERESIRKEDAEEKRVFYVASTRARERAVSFLWQPTRSGLSFMKMLRSANGFIKPTDQRFFSPVVPRERIHRVSTEESMEGPEKLAESIGGKTQIRLEAVGRLPVVTPSLLINESKHVVEREFDKEPDPEDDGANRRETAQKLGQLCHKVLELWNFNSDKDVKKAVRLAARFFDGTPDIVAEASDILQAFLKSDAALRLSRQTHLGREIPFLYPGGASDPHQPDLIRGVIDLLYRDETGLVVADYKTNYINGRREDVVNTYRVQGEIYKEAVRRVLGETPAFELVFLRTGEAIRL